MLKPGVIQQERKRQTRLRIRANYPVRYGLELTFEIYHIWLKLAYDNIIQRHITIFIIYTRKGPAQARISTEIFHDGLRRETCSDTCAIPHYFVRAFCPFCKIFEGYLCCGMILNVWTKLSLYPACLSYLSTGFISRSQHVRCTAVVLVLFHSCTKSFLVSYGLVTLVLY